MRHEAELGAEEDRGPCCCSGLMLPSGDDAVCLNYFV